MPVTSSSQDSQALSLTIVTELAAAPEQVWKVWSDPRLLERWWGPPEWPATFTQHEFRPGGSCRYHMTGPEGDEAHGWWNMVAVDAPRRIELEDGFADQQGNPDPTFGTGRVVVTLDGIAGGTRLTIASTFASGEQMDQMLQMGMEEGMRLAMGQIDAVLAEVA